MTEISAMSFEASVTELKRLLRESSDCDPWLRSAMERFFDVLEQSLQNHINDCNALCRILKENRE
jgi:hypothetical protein